MDWKATIAELVTEHSMSQPQIAAVCGCAQSSISAIARGDTKDPRHSTGEALLKLLADKRREAAEKGAPAPADGAAPDRRDPHAVNPFPDLDRRGSRAASELPGAVGEV